MLTLTPDLGPEACTSSDVSLKTRLLIKVLLIEDSKIDAAILKNELKRYGFKPVLERIETADELKVALTTKTWDIIIADYNLPGFNAIKALELLQESGLDIPLIVISGTVGEEVAVETMQAGARDYVMKDRLMRLGPAIKRELADRELRQHNAKNQKELDAIQRAKDLIISTLAHDLKSPIVTSVNLLEQLSNGHFGPVTTEQNELILELTQTRRYESHLVDNILSVFSNQSLNMHDSFQSIDVNQLIQEHVVPMFQYMAESKVITLNIDLEKELPPVRLNPLGLQRVLNNLLYNAFNYTSLNGTITIESRLVKSEIILTVKDTGAGIEDQYLKALFHECEPTNSRFHTGAGLGLYLSKKIIDLHNGRIWLKTEVGKGSQFFVALPVL